MASIRKRTNQDGSVSYRVDVRLKGFPPQRATFKRLTDAKQWATNTESAIRENRYFKTAEARKHTFKDMVDRYIRDVLPMKSEHAQKAQKAQLEWWKSQLGDYTLADVNAALITDCRDKLLTTETKRKRQRTPATVVRYMAALSHAFSVAVNEWEWMEVSPMRRVKKPKEPRGRVRYLSDNERKRLLEACRNSNNKNLYPAVVLALSTGMRQGEVMGLKWDDVDFQRGRIVLHETKNDERRVVPLAGHAFDVLKEHSKVRHLKSSLVFPGRRKPEAKVRGLSKSETDIEKPMDLRQPWLAALKEAKIDDFRFHDLRHSTASYLAMNGASLAEIAEVLGHKTLQMVKRYAHLSEAHTASVVSRMNDKIFG